MLLGNSFSCVLSYQCYLINRPSVLTGRPSSPDKPLKPFSPNFPCTTKKLFHNHAVFSFDLHLCQLFHAFLVIRSYQELPVKNQTVKTSSRNDCVKVTINLKSQIAISNLQAKNIEIHIIIRNVYWEGKLKRYYSKELKERNLLNFKERSSRILPLPSN